MISSKYLEAISIVITLCVFTLFYLIFPLKIEGDLLRWVGELHYLKSQKLPFRDFSLQYPAGSYILFNKLISVFGFKLSLYLSSLALFFALFSVLRYLEFGIYEGLSILSLIFILTLRSDSVRFFSIQWYSPSVLVGMIFLLLQFLFIARLKVSNLSSLIILSIFNLIQFNIKPEYFVASLILSIGFILIKITKPKILYISAHFSILMCILFLTIELGAIHFEFDAFTGYSIADSFNCDIKDYKIFLEFSGFGILCFLVVASYSFENYISSPIVIFLASISLLLLANYFLHYVLVFLFFYLLYCRGSSIRNYKVLLLFSLTILFLDLRSFPFSNHYSQNIIFEILGFSIIFKRHIRILPAWFFIFVLTISLSILIYKKKSTSMQHVSVLNTSLPVDRLVKEEYDLIDIYIGDNSFITINYGLGYESIKNSFCGIWLTQWVRLKESGHNSLITNAIRSCSPKYILSSNLEGCLERDAELYRNSSEFLTILKNYEVIITTSNYKIYKKIK